MRTHVTFYKCDKPVAANAEVYWEKKLPRIERLLQHYAPDEADLRLTVWHHPERVGYEARAVLHLPSGTLVADRTDKDLHAAMDAAADTLIRELKKHEERLRHDDVYRRHRQRRLDVSAAGPMLQRDMEMGRQQAFFQLLRPILRNLRRYAHRELLLLEMEGLLPKHEWTLNDLLDEVLLRAWRRFAEKPKEAALEVWLMDLLHEVLAEWTQTPPTESLEQEAPSSEEEPWWSEPLGYKEELRLEDLIPDYRSEPAWEALSAGEQHEKLLVLLSQMPAPQRQAFLLHALEDYQPFEIAMILDRSEEQVRKDIEQARQYLAQQLLSAGYAAPKADTAADQQRKT